MTATGKVDAIQAAVMKAASAAMSDYSKRNPTPDGKGSNLPPREYVEKIIRSRLEAGSLVDAFVDDALALIPASKLHKVEE